MSELNSKTLVIAAGIFLVLALLFLATPILIISTIAVGLFGFIHSITQAARHAPVKVSADK